MDQRPPQPEANNVRTFYQRPWLDRLTGHYTVAWENEGRVASIRIRNRLTDMEGHRPALASLLRIPATVKTYFEAKRRTILKTPVPFLVYEAIEHMEPLIGPGKKVVELGGGNSTLWFLERGAEVTTIEHSEEWARQIRSEAATRLGDEAASRLTLHVAAGDEAIAFASSLPEASFDLALVDCMNAFTWRLDGVQTLAPKVRSGGTLCLDNSDHPNNWAAVSLLGRDHRTRFTGYAPMCPVVTQTSFWTLP
ncbi:Methyltransferase domain protein [Planctomycetes bacterium Poly30]|uniref:Methyltransferase domain protein n=1 Tax=Saltatorellus ferox TaxID=2528018 RepID=A0A518EPN9_9BACT|nr:Methyltransferase domain protein [Planctomycetes bacterium Poly30]